MIGHITQQVLLEMRVDKAILDIHGIDTEAGLAKDYWSVMWVPLVSVQSGALTSL